ncbi:taste receptor type 2 member 40-like [Hyperolius riggenbachi]|uniref:taste receptor type 2 member 40-like n=1 Tax=Hyperolius riggenbachi TaxID=752182 RepID=UPI0035A29E50
MLSASVIIPVVVHSTLFATCLTGGLFILIVNCLDWSKHNKENTGDLIINCIVTINLILQATVAFNEICVVTYLEFYIQFWVANSLIFIMCVLVFSSLWCTTCLCFYYCVKIVNFNGDLFHKIKARISTMVPWLLVFSNVISWITGLPVYLDIFIDSPLFYTNATRDSSSFALNVKSKCNCLFYVFMLVSSIAFSIISLTAGAIIISLNKHMKQMEKNSDGSARLTSLRSAAQTVTSLLVTYLVLFGSMSVIFNETHDGSGSIMLIFFALGACCPTVNNIILINGNRKLSNRMKQLFGKTSRTANAGFNETT